MSDAVLFEIIQFSEPCANIAKAFVAAQKQFAPYKADNTALMKSDKANYSYKYADLGGLLAATRPALNEQGIAILQGPATTDSGQSVTVETLLLHETGEWIRHRFAMKAATNTPQATGSGVTYVRRYAAQSLLGVAADDDDGRGASDTAAEAAQKLLDDAQRQIDDMPKKLHNARIEIEKLIAAKRELDQPTIVRLLQEMTSSARAEWQSLGLPELRSFYSVLKAWKPDEPATNGPTVSELSPQTALETRGAGTDDSQVAPSAETAPEAQETLLLAGPATLPADAIAYIEVELGRLHLPEDIVMEITSDVAIAHDFTTYSWRELATGEIAKEFIRAARKRAKELAAV